MYGLVIVVVDRRLRINLETLLSGKMSRRAGHVGVKRFTNRAFVPRDISIQIEWQSCYARQKIMLSRSRSSCTIYALRFCHAYVIIIESRFV